MFKKVRLRLSLWYLLVIMFISIFFSSFIYMILSFTIDSGFEGTLNEIRLKLEDNNDKFPFLINESFLENIENIKSMVLYRLILTNGAILIVSMAVSYFLAGRTLKPIEKMVDEQKRFIADASHEFRTPLTALTSSTEVALMDKGLTLEESKKILKSNLGDIGRLKCLSDNLLSLAEHQKSDLNLCLEKVDIWEVIKDAYRKLLPLAEEKNIQIKLEEQNITLVADRQRLTDLVVILLDNSIKYTPSGGEVTVTVQSKDSSTLIKVKDMGIGIESKDLPHIFNRFYRGDKSRSKTSVSGFGLGLSLAKEIVEKHKGTIAVSSIPGVGTTFTITLPKKTS